MNAMPMGGGSAHAWFAAPAAFIGMWIVMMVPMMLPSVLPVLWRYRQAAATHSDAHADLTMALMSGGYLFVWSVIGVAAMPLSVALTRLAPIASGTMIVIAGALQFTAWKAHHLACFRRMPPRGMAERGAGWRHGIRLGLECARCCGNLMIIPLVLGTMDVRIMALVGAAITLERLVPAGRRVALATGVAAIATGLILIANASVVRLR
jgi:predicted metal-binding membrane protein